MYCGLNLTQRVFMLLALIFCYCNFQLLFTVTYDNGNIPLLIGPKIVDPN